jgi:hypothetical protein
MNFGETYTIIKDDPNDSYIEVRYSRMHMPYNVYQSAIDSIRTHEKNIFNSGLNIMLKPSVEVPPPPPVESMPPPPPVESMPLPLPVELVPQAPKNSVYNDVNNILTNAVNMNLNKSKYKNTLSKVCVDWVNYKCYNTNCNKAHYIDRHYKRSICRYWQKNICTFDAHECTFAHGNHDITYYKSRDRSRSRSRTKYNY